MPQITPIAAVPAPNLGPDNAAFAAGTVLKDQPSGDGVDLIVHATQNVSLRPYFFVPVPFGHGLYPGWWCPLGGDSAAGVGTQPVSAAPAAMGGGAHGRFQFAERGATSWVVVMEAGAPGDVDFVELSVVRRALD